MLPVILLVSIFAVGCLGAPYSYGPEPPKKVVEIPIPKAVTRHKPLRQDKPFDYHETVPIKRTEVRRITKKVPLIHEVPIFVHKNKPFLTPVAVPRMIQVHEVVGIPVIHDKHVIQPFYVDRPYIVEKKKFVDQPYPVHKPVPIDFLKRITKIYDRKVEVPHDVPIPLIKTIDKPRPVPFTREVVQYYDVHIKVPKPKPIKLTKHITHVEKVPFETPNVIIQKKPKHHVIREFIPKVPQVHVEKFRIPSPKYGGFHGRVSAGSPEDRAATGEAQQFGPRSGGRVVSVKRGPGFGVIGPRFAPQPRILATEFFDGRTGQPLRGGIGGGGGGGSGGPGSGGNGSGGHGGIVYVSGGRGSGGHGSGGRGSGGHGSGGRGSGGPGAVVYVSGGHGSGGHVSGGNGGQRYSGDGYVDYNWGNGYYNSVRAGRPQFRAGPVREGKPFLIKSFVAGGKKRGGGGGVAWGYGGGNGRFGGGQGGANVIIGGGSNKGNGGYWGRR